MKRFVKPGWLMVYAVIIYVGIRIVWGVPQFVLHETITLRDGASVEQIYQHIGWIDRLRTKRYMRTHEEKLSSIQQGSYVFSGKYTPAEIVEVLDAGPVATYAHITILEGWSIYDTDALLTREELIEPGAYVDFVHDQEIIKRYSQRYAFLAQASQERDTLSSLEGYLYPDTYYIDIDKDIVDQLVYLQLETFQKKIWQPYGDQLTTMSSILQPAGYSFPLSSYGAIILGSIIEKEERNDINKGAIASIFYNRLAKNMRIDADISLCYGLHEGYATCTPEIIVEHLYDTSNPYNTRAVAGLPPTPITTPTSGSVRAMLKFVPSDDLFYLHAPDGTLHTAATSEEHTINKRRYLQ